MGVTRTYFETHPRKQSRRQRKLRAAREATAHGITGKTQEEAFMFVALSPVLRV